MFYKLLIKILLLLVISSCSTMGHVAKGTFKYGTEFYNAQPKVITDNYPTYFKQTFFKGALFITDYDVWKLRILSIQDITEYIENNSIFVDLEYEMDFQNYSKSVPLIFESQSLLESDGRALYAYDFSFSPEGKDFWVTFHDHFFKRDLPSFNYPISPVLPPEIKRNIDSIQYAYVPNWGFLTLREFMVLYSSRNGKRWDEFCFWNNYAYDDSTVCGDIQIEDEPEIIKVTTN
ncbi:hypothetical protein RT723_10685 [Psychrosphaera aquimarina]|uniref:Lipoprotein n=1 Tax=Psychrosphaera aquimarina TaxID=2044854 RepID=A0ABU3R193_9GAMM|nr:hypothetical protein [Psychrosphaera aquimarina]MDU0113454.1 hypothetical protein [Psychrosphaera aquimarina]